MFVNGQADWKRMKSSFDELILKYPDPWNYNNYARFACMAQDFLTMRELDKKIAGNPIPIAWNNDIGDYNQCSEIARYFKS